MTHSRKAHSAGGSGGEAEEDLNLSKGLADGDLDLGHHPGARIGPLPEDFSVV